MSRANLFANPRARSAYCSRSHFSLSHSHTLAIATSCTTFTPLTPTTPSVTTTTHTITSLGTVIGTIYLHLQFPNGTTYAANTELNEDGEPVFDYDVIVTGCPYTPATACGSGDWLEVLTMGTKGDGGPVRTVVRSPFDDGYHDDSVAEAKVSGAPRVCLCVCFCVLLCSHMCTAHPGRSSQFTRTRRTSSTRGGSTLTPSPRPSTTRRTSPTPPPASSITSFSTATSRPVTSRRRPASFSSSSTLDPSSTGS